MKVTLDNPLPSGEVFTFTYTSTATAGGVWANIVNVSSDIEDQQISNNTTSANVSVGALVNLSDLVISKGSNVDEVNSGGVVTYTLTITNNGPDDATGVVVTDFMAGSFASISNIQISPAMGTCGELNGLITCSIAGVPSMPGFNSFTVTYDVQAGEPGYISNLANVGAAVNDPDQSNNTAAKQVEVLGNQADLSITKVVDKNPALVGDTIAYKILVKNEGPDTAINAIMVDQISGLFSNVSATTPVGTCNVTSAQEKSATVICELGDISSGGSVEIEVLVTGEGVTSVLSNLASVFSETEDPLLGNNAATADTFQVEGSIIPTPTPTAQPILEGSGISSGCSLNPSAAATGSLWWYLVASLFLAGMPKLLKRNN